MLGMMQQKELLVSSLIEHAERCHPNVPIISRTAEGPVHRSNYGQVARRSRRLANALGRLGMQPGDRIGTLAWNGFRHMELYFAVSGAGGVLHTINPRLFQEQLEYIVNHADDQYLFFDINFAALVEKLAPRLPNVKGFIAMTDRANMPECKVANLLCYEELLECESEAFAWPELDEESAAALCYTSGTTGNPKGVLYSHRSSLLHAFAACSVDGLGLGSADSALLVVPMFHVNAWGMPYAGAMCGAKLVLPGPALDGPSVYALMRSESVTLALGVPTVWQMLFRHVEASGARPREELCLQRVVIGGSAAPVSMIDAFEEQFGATVVHAWGMTELSPMGSVCRLLPKHEVLPLADRRAIQARQGRAVFGVAMKITGEDGRELPRDGKASGHLLVRGPWVAASYFRNEGGPILDADGWFDTGDIATIDADGYMQITDRSKDVIKSGGEWISSIDLENAAMGHPAVAEAAVIGIAHPKWQERPLLVVVRKAGCELDAAAMLAYLAPRVAKWWLPDDVQFVDTLPHTATGKLQKMKLREMFKDYRLPADSRATVVIIPGLRDHVDDHWQTWLARGLPGSRTVPPLQENGLDLAARVAAIEAVVNDTEGPLVLVAHSAGVLMTVHWAAQYCKEGHRVRAALLATPPDLGAAWPAKYPAPEVLAANGWSPLPMQPLPFPTVVAASSNDPLATLEAVRAMAASWGSRVVELGAVGHLNPAAGFGQWPQAGELVDSLQQM